MRLKDLVWVAAIWRLHGLQRWAPTFTNPRSIERVDGQKIERL